MRSLWINAMVGGAVVVALCAVPSSVTGPEIDARLAVIAVGLAAFAAAVVDVAAAAISVGVGFLLFDGFVEGDHGDLVWNGRADVIRLGVLCLAAFRYAFPADAERSRPAGSRGVGGGLRRARAGDLRGGRSRRWPSS